MARVYALPLLAAGLAGFALVHSLWVQRPEPNSPPPVAPPRTPFGETVAGVGMIEAATEASGTGNIAVGSQSAGTVVAVQVGVGQTVKAGDPLFELDGRQARAELIVRRATLATAEDQLQRLRLQPRPEELPVMEAQVEVAEANLRQQEDLYERAKKLVGTASISQQEFVTSQQGYQSARSQVALVRASLALLRAGAWEADKAIAAANIEQAKALVEQAKTTLAVLQIRAPVDGTILQVNVRPGEYVSTSAGQSLVLMGNLRPLHVRVSIDEEDLPRLRPYARARAKVRGDAGQDEIPLAFVRREFFVVPKASLTGMNTERVDTRVAQFIYAVDADHRLVREGAVMVGQLVDVFVDAHATNAAEGREPVK